MKTVLVAMSGGLDSSMTAFLLKEMGYKVIGVTMAVWDERYLSVEDKDLGGFKGGCFGPTEAEDIEAAQKVCEQLNIEHIVVDLKAEYNRSVLTYFRDNYLQGLTPNPCIMCNQKIKFALIPKKVRDLGVDYDLYATGHYVRTHKENDYVYIREGKDSSKDQSYFLCRLQQNLTRNLIFPLGDMLKKDVRELAREAGFISLAEKAESQDFIDSSDYTCLFDNKGQLEGDILDMQGNKIGRHKGIIYYTIGKRRGLNISGLSEPYYVTYIDADKNIIYAGPKSELYKNRLIADNIVWSDVNDREGVMKAKIRLHHKKAECEIRKLNDGSYDVIFSQEQSAITPGQIIAFFDDDVVIGGAIIKSVY